jgi:hypothetical protein
MPKRTFHKTEVEEACWEGKSTRLTRAHQGNWVSEGKYDYRDNILQTKDGKFYSHVESRSGSYFTDYYYSWENEPDEIELTEVREVEKTIKVWEAVD